MQNLIQAQIKKEKQLVEGLVTPIPKSDTKKPEPPATVALLQFKELNSLLKAGQLVANP